WSAASHQAGAGPCLASRHGRHRRAGVAGILAAACGNQFHYRVQTVGAAMKSSALNVIVCPACKNELTLHVQSKEGDEVLEGTLACAACASAYPITRGVPRFVPQDAYAESFGRQWNWFRTVQIDSLNQSMVSEKALRDATGWRDEEYEGRRLLDAGVGAGRFAERAAAKGAEVFGVDLTS